jgi:N-acetylglucosaminyl-diphospho-decaprenol L-rhamnosyltransferase
MQVVAAVPNYNMRDSLGRLLARLQAEEFGRVYVLDDASTDGSADYVAAEFPWVTLVRGERNAGAAANRNRLLPLLSGDEGVLFLDADLELRSAGLVPIVRGWLADDSLGMVGGLLVDREGHPSNWNYGWTMNPVRDAREQVIATLATIAEPGSALLEALRKIAAVRRTSFNLEIKHAAPVGRDVEWVSEALFAIRARRFGELGGYDERFRYHSGQDLCLRLRQAGRRVRFDPAIAACHLEIDVRGGRRGGDYREGQYLFYNKHVGMSRRVFDFLMSGGAAPL